MKLEINIVDAFAEKLFKGNPAAVIITSHWLSDDLMQSIAVENNLSETAFVVSDGGPIFHIRWFSPITEVAFCGHATMAAAFILFEKHVRMDSIKFLTKSMGEFLIEKAIDGTIQMNFPNTKPVKLESVPDDLKNGLSVVPYEVYCNRQAYFVIYKSEAEVLSVLRDNEVLSRLKPLDVVVTSRSESLNYDFISRYFWPANGGDEDPVTGSIHTGLAPFWADRLGKDKLVGYQASSRGGVVNCNILGDRVLISGNAVKYLSGTIEV